MSGVVSVATLAEQFIASGTGSTPLIWTTHSVLTFNKRLENAVLYWVRWFKKKSSFHGQGSWPPTKNPHVP